MLEITNVKLSKNTVNAGEKYVISVDINEIIDYPYDFPYDFPVSCTRKAEPEKQVNAWKSEQDRKVLFLYAKLKNRGTYSVCRRKYNHYGWKLIDRRSGYFSAIFAVYKWYLKQNQQDKEIERMKSEQCLLTYGILACLKGLKEQGCNGPVTEAIDKIQKHINKQAHDQED